MSEIDGRLVVWSSGRLVGVNWRPSGCMFQRVGTHHRSLQRSPRTNGCALLCCAVLWLSQVRQGSSGHGCSAQVVVGSRVCLMFPRSRVRMLRSLGKGKGGEEHHHHHFRLPPCSPSTACSVKPPRASCFTIPVTWCPHRPLNRPTERQTDHSASSATCSAADRKCEVAR